MNQEILNLILGFMQRVQLQGNEVEAFVTVVNAVQQELEAQKNPASVAPAGDEVA